MNYSYFGYNKEIHEKAEYIITHDVLANQTNLVECLINLVTIGTLEETRAYKEHGLSAFSIDNIHCQEEDIYEWWLVSRWLADKLEDNKEPILRTCFGTFWGRTCTGQSIIADGIIQEIVKDSIY